uniref:Atlastin-2 n=1 Tax=Phallusia mammillata TaxID=59560 RepID=A0A6F9D7B1_9ASCI|nr:atlastin-2 [Phallusia mammillata]
MLATTVDILHQLDGENGEAILISPSDEKVVTKNKLLQLFQDVRKMPVAIYSIVGAYRKGKSFIMNLFLKYLEGVAKGKTNNDWKETNNTNLGGFSWRGGMEPNTKGVLIYSKHFVIKNATGQKVAVFLMDTQGLFDSETSVTECSCIFALSTLISSVQIYNLSQQIQEDNLQYLQLFTDYGQALQKRGTKHKNRYSFQNLLFLIRDWPHKTTSYGWEGGERMLNKVLEVGPHTDGGLKSIRKYIKASFENVSCFLMPHPGKKIAQREDGNHMYVDEDMKPEFKLYLNALAEDLFSPQKLSWKKIGEKPANGQNMIDFISATLPLFDPTTVPTIGTLLESAADLTAKKVLADCDELCKQEWQKLSNSTNFFGEEEIQTKSMEIENKLLEHFNSHMLLGDQALKAENEQTMLEKHRMRTSVFKQGNTEKISKHKEQYKRDVEAAVKWYRDELEQQMNRKTDVDRFDGKILEKLGDAIELKILKQFDHTHHDSMKIKYQNRLKEKVGHCFRDLSSRIDLEKKNAKDSMKKLTHECFRVFKDFVQQTEAEKAKKDKLTEIYNQAKQNAFKKFDEESKQYSSAFTETYHKKLEQQISELQNTEQALWNAQKEKARIRFFQNINDAQLAYKKKKDKEEMRSKNGYLNPKELDQLHKKCQAEAEKCLQEKFPEWKEEKDFSSSLDEFYETQYEMLKHNNEAIKNKIILAFKASAVTCVKEYNYQMAQKILAQINESEHTKKHQAALDQALDKFEKSHNGRNLESEKKKHRKELCETIEKEHQRNVETLAKQKETSMEIVADLRGNCLQTYMQHMTARLANPVNDERFIQVHDYSSEQALLQYDKATYIKDEKMKNEMRSKLIELIEEHQSKMLESNKNKQITEQCVDDELLDERIQKKKKKALAGFNASINEIAQSLVEPFQSQLERDLQKFAMQIKIDNRKKQKQMQMFADNCVLEIYQDMQKKCSEVGIAC